MNGKYLCMITSLDLQFSEDVHYNLDFVDEFYLYPSEMDDCYGDSALN